MRYTLVLLIVLGTAACRIKSFAYRLPVNGSDTLLAGVVRQAGIRGEDTSMTGQADIYRVRFREQLVEENNVLEWRMISENDPRFIHSDSDMTNGKDIYLYRLRTAVPKNDIWIYFVMGVRPNDSTGLPDCTGIGHAYLGKLGTENNSPVIHFYERFDLRVKDKACLIGKRRKRCLLKKKIKRTPGNYALEVNEKSAARGFAENILYFSLSSGSDYTDKELTIKKIVYVEKNKTGGNNPIFYPIDEMLGENAMRMKKIK